MSTRIVLSFFPVIGSRGLLPLSNLRDSLSNAAAAGAVPDTLINDFPEDHLVPEDHLAAWALAIVCVN